MNIRMVFSIWNIKYKSVDFLVFYCTYSKISWNLPLYLLFFASNTIVLLAIEKFWVAIIIICKRLPHLRRDFELFFDILKIVKRRHLFDFVTRFILVEKWLYILFYRMTKNPKVQYFVINIVIYKLVILT